MEWYANILKFFAEKMWVAFAVQKLLTFFQQKISEYCILNPLKQLKKWPLTSSLSKRRFEQLGPDLQVYLSWGSWGSTVESFHSLQSLSVSCFHVILGLPEPMLSINLYVTGCLYCTTGAFHMSIPAEPSLLQNEIQILKVKLCK